MLCRTLFIWRSRICSVCRNHDPVLSSFMTYHWVWYKSNTTGATRGTGTAYPFGTPEFIPVSVGFVLVFLVMFCRSLFCLFWGVTVLSVLFRFTAFFLLPLCYIKAFLECCNRIELIILLTRRGPLVEQELLTLPEHLSLPPVVSGFLLLDL